MCGTDLFGRPQPGLRPDVDDGALQADGEAGADGEDGTGLGTP